MSDESVCVALYDFQASESDELSFAKDDVLEVIEKQEDDWWLVRRNTEVGLIPSNYVYTAVSSPKEKVREKPIMKTQRVNEAAAKHHQSKIPKLSHKQGYSQSNSVRNSVRPAPSAQHGHGNVSSVKPAPSAQYGHGNVSNSADLLRLQELREEAEIKIDQLRIAVTNQEKGSQNDSKDSIIEKLNELLVASSSNSDETDLIRDMKSVMKKHLSSWSGHAVQQQQVKQPTKSHIKPVPNELRQRNIVLHTNSASQGALNLGVDGGNSVASYGSVTSHDKLPNISNSPTYATPAHQNIPKKKQLLSPLQQSTVVEGIRYPQCRSLVYKPSESPDNDSILSSQPPTSKLALKYVHGYDGDIGRHGGTIRGKNIMFVNANRVVFPAAALVVVMDINTNTTSGARHNQGFFSGHNEDVTCVTIHPERAICASGQMGKDGRICVWDQSLIEPGHREYHSLIELYMAGGVRGVCGLNFSGDGAFLVALGIDESHTIVIFDWANGNAVASARVGHSEVFQMGFNPYLYVGVDKFVDAIGSPHKLSYDDQQPAGCYTLITCGGRQIKFWTFKKYLERNDQLTIDAAGFRGRQMPKSKYNWVSKYVLEGTNGIFPKSHHPHPAHNSTGHSPDHPDITCFVSVCDDDDDSGESMPKSRIFTGTSTGAIYIWSFVIEPNPNGLLDGLVTWQPKGRLLSVITDVHDAPICDLDYTGRWNPFEYEDDEDDSNLIKKVSPRTNRLWSERIVSCSKDGTINVWKVDRSNNLQSLPFEHISGINISTTDITTSNPRSIHWDLSGTVAIVGTTANSILLLTGDGLVTNTSLDNNDTKNGSIQIDPILRSNAGKVRRVVSHPYYNIYLTLSSDKTIRLWDGSNHSQISCYKFHEKISCGAFSPDGKAIAIGNESGELVVLECALLLQGGVSKQGGDGLGTDHWKIIMKKNVAAKTGKIPVPSDGKAVGAHGGEESPRGGGGRKPNNRKVIEKTHEVLELKYSPNGEILAVGCRDNLIHLLMVSSNYKRQAVCRGHSSHIKNIDFSADSTVIQSTDVVRELLFWNTATGKQINNAYAVRNVDWFTWTNIYGWPVQGVFNGTKGAVQEGEINAVCRSHNSNLLVAGASNTVDCCVKLYRYPCLENAMPYVYGGHTSPVLDVTFLPDDNKVVSVGGNDATIFEWDVESV